MAAFFPAVSGEVCEDCETAVGPCGCPTCAQLLAAVTLPSFININMEYDGQAVTQRLKLVPGECRYVDHLDRLHPFWEFGDDNWFCFYEPSFEFIADDDNPGCYKWYAYISNISVSDFNHSIGLCDGFDAGTVEVESDRPNLSDPAVVFTGFEDGFHLLSYISTTVEA